MRVKTCAVGEAMEWLGTKLGMAREKIEVEKGSWLDATADDVRARAGGQSGDCYECAQEHDGGAARSAQQ